MEPQGHQKSGFFSWLILFLIILIILIQGAFSLKVVGDLGQPDWDYRPILDVPGESAYAIDKPYHALPYGQHVRGKLGKEENPLHLKALPLQGVE